jgi:hypothetical protein
MEKIIEAIKEKIQETRDAISGQLLILLPHLHDHEEHLALTEMEVLKSRIELIVRLEVKLNEIEDISESIKES